MNHVCPRCGSDYDCSASIYCIRPVEASCELLTCSTDTAEPWHRRVSHFHLCVLHGQYRCIEVPCILRAQSSGECPECAYEEARRIVRSRVLWNLEVAG